MLKDRLCTAQLQGPCSWGVEETLTISLYLMELCLVTSKVTGLCPGGGT